MFVISLDYKVPLDVMDQHRPAHLDWLQKHYDAGLFLASGRKVPPIGGIILAKGMKREDLDALLKSDPFAQHDLASYDVVEFEAKMTAPALKDFV